MRKKTMTFPVASEDLEYSQPHTAVSISVDSSYRRLSVAVVVLTIHSLVVLR